MAELLAGVRALYADMVETEHRHTLREVSRLLKRLL